MPSGVLIRKLALPGDYADGDWLDPAVTPEANSPRLQMTGSEVTFVLIGRASTAQGANPANLAGVTVDAYLASEVGGHLTRGQSLVEVEGGNVDTRIKIKGSGLTRGEIVRLHLQLINVGALAALDVYLLSGARPVGPA